MGFFSKLFSKKVSNNLEDNFTTIIKFTGRKKLSKLRAQFEENKIEFRILKGRTMEKRGIYQPDFHWINTTEFQVRIGDIQKSIEILKEGGYITDKDLWLAKNLNKLDNLTSRIPILKKLQLELRLIIIFVFLVLLIMGIVHFVM